MYKSIFALLLCIATAESKNDSYEYVPSVGRYIKMHKIPANWQEARLRCHLEGGILASPDDNNMLAAMSKIMHDRQVRVIYTGIHATYSKGDYTTLTGTPLSQIDVKWPEPDNFRRYEDCVVMYSSEWLADADCTKTYQFMCHKSPEKIGAHSCGYSQDFNSSNSDYVLYNETGSCYKFHKEGRSWSAAFRTCQAEDAYLAIINSEKESHYLKELLAENPPNTIPGNFEKKTVSIGFTKLDDLQDFFTIHGQSLTEAGFAVFHEGEPNNAGNNEKCGSVFRNGLLNDHNCNTRLTFICEKPALTNEDQHTSVTFV